MTLTVEQGPRLRHRLGKYQLTEEEQEIGLIAVDSHLLARHPRSLQRRKTLAWVRRPTTTV